MFANRGFTIRITKHAFKYPYKALNYLSLNIINNEIDQILMKIFTFKQSHIFEKNAKMTPSTPMIACQIFATGLFL